MLDTYDAGAARHLDRRDWRAAKLVTVICGGALAQIFGFSFHFRPNFSGAWFFVWMGLLPLAAYITGRLIEARWHVAPARWIAGAALVVQLAGALISALILAFYAVVVVANLVG